MEGTMEVLMDRWESADQHQRKETNGRAKRRVGILWAKKTRNSRSTILITRLKLKDSRSNNWRSWNSTGCREHMEGATYRAGSLAWAMKKTPKVRCYRKTFWLTKKATITRTSSRISNKTITWGSRVTRCKTPLWFTPMMGQKQPRVESSTRGSI
jgi:hypothetical protein